MALSEEVHDGALRAMGNLHRMQGDDGAWSGDYGGPLFLLPIYVALCHAARRQPPESAGMIAYLLSVQNADGSFGLHAEDENGSMFTTCLGYVALRLLGIGPDEPRLIRMRRFIHAHGTPLGAASWGKFTLALLGLYDYRGLHPVLPELWLLPRFVPAHPGRLWCHSRQVYLPMAWLYGAKASIPPDELVLALREELYDGKWSAIDWPSHRNTLAPFEAYRPPTRILRAAQAAMARFESANVGVLRRRALAKIREHIDYEDRATSDIDIGPVNKVLNAFVHYFEDPDGERFRRSFAACEAYLWHGDDGTKMQGYNSSKLWDAAFAMQAILASPDARDSSVAEEVLEHAFDYVRDNQIVDEVPEPSRHFRHPCRGGWPFSNRAHGWPITDCTAEALKCALLFGSRTSHGEEMVSKELLVAAVKLLLSWQNDDGGWATYERQRGGAWLEALNPSEVFGDIMVDYSYVECTSACMQALKSSSDRVGFEFELEFGDVLRRAIDQGARFLRRKQRPDGSFEGSWGVCFTYGTWFGVSGLLASGATPRDPSIERACAFLLSRQRVDGSWGEHGKSCRERRYVEAPRGSVTQTAWALSALVRSDHRDRDAQSKAVRFLLSKQSADGGWPREPMVGVFNRTCLINYENYRHYFPLWALGEWQAANAP